MLSPRPGFSILMTSAPMSPRSEVHQGPAAWWLMSITLMPASAPVSRSDPMRRWRYSRSRVRSTGRLPWFERSCFIAGRMSLADLLRRRTADPAHAARTYLRFEDERVSFAETGRRAARWANLLLAERRNDGPFHVGLLLENRPEFVYAELGAAMAGAVVVGLNPTRRGAHLAADLALADCHLVVTESRFAPLLDEALTPALRATVRVLDVDADTQALLARHSDVDPRTPVGFDDVFLLVFTSGTTGGPKAVMRGHGRLALMAEGAVG